SARAEANAAPSVAQSTEPDVPRAEAEGEDGAAVPAKGLEATDEWQRLVTVWREAEEIASGKRGDYPFDEAGKKRVLAELDRAARDVEALSKAELLSPPEAGLLTAELATLTKGVRRKRPTEMRRATCYKPMMVVPARESLKRLKARLPMLEALAAKGVVKNDVIRRVLVRAARDAIFLLFDKDGLGRLSEDERAEAKRLGTTAVKLFKELAPQRLDMMINKVVPAPRKGEPDASIIRRRMDLLAGFAGERALGDDAAKAALRSAKADLAKLEGGHA
ncbi:MAG: hypothetical protein ACYTKD_16335, partial [Planctomycetota bacterium]